MQTKDVLKFPLVFHSKEEFLETIDHATETVEKLAYAKGKRDGESASSEKLHEKLIERVAEVRGAGETKSTDPVALAARAAELQAIARKEGRVLDNILAVREAYREAGVSIS